MAEVGEVGVRAGHVTICKMEGAQAAILLLYMDAPALRREVTTSQYSSPIVQRSTFTNFCPSAGPQVRRLNNGRQTLSKQFEYGYQY